MGYSVKQDSPEYRWDLSYKIRYKRWNVVNPLPCWIKEKKTKGKPEERIRKNNRLSIITKDNIGYGADDQVKSESLLVIGRIEFQDLT